MADETVLSYHDSLLRASDLSTLGAGVWLNDKVIGFYFESVIQPISYDIELFYSGRY